jgi:beta-mannosidase
MEMSGRWVATAATDDIRRFGIELDVDDDEGWVPIDVPGHWQDTAAFAASDGPLMYRYRFAADPPASGRRRWVTFDGVFYQADAWLDGAYLGDPEGYFFPQSFEVTELSRLGEEHVLAVEVACTPQSVSGRTNITGILQNSAGMPTGWNPGGLWRPVRIYETGPVRIDRLRVVCREADDRRAHLRVGVLLDSDQARQVLIRTRSDGEVVDEQHPTIAVGENEIEWAVDLEQPALWWPFELGDQNLTDIEVEIEVDGIRSDIRRRRTGLRQVEWHDWVCSINGERLFLRGVNLTPISVGLGDTTPALVERDLDLAMDLGLNALRLRGHISTRDLYDSADRRGLLILQDFPLEGTLARSTRGRAVHQARAAVDSLGHHPSIAMWIAHNEPAAIDPTEHAGWRRRLREVAAQQVPSWNKSVLDRWVKRSFERADPSRPAIAHSGVLPHLPQLDGTDSHLWYGWRYGEADELAGRAKVMPRSVRFVSEFGAQAVPTSAPFIDEQLAAHRWPDLDWDTLARDHGYDRATFETVFPPADFSTFDEWRATTQYYQAHVLKVQIETLRRLKYRPTGGFTFSSLADAAPTISTSVLDHQRTPKDAYAVVRTACAPIIVVVTQPPDWVNPGDRLRLDVHLVNDLRVGIDSAEVTVEGRWAGGRKRWRFGGPVPDDAVVKVGTLTLDIPDTLGELAIALVATDGDEQLARNRYTTAITLPPTS